VMRMNTNDVVTAYKVTGLIPIRKAWETTDERGVCAIDAIAAWLGAETNGEAWAADNLNHNYTQGFIEAWDADEPKILDERENPKEFLIGYWDAILCREAVEEEFASIHVVSTH